MPSFPTWTLPEGLDTPCLVVDVDILDANIARMAEAMAEHGVDLRPHCKTHKSVEVARRQLGKGAVGLTVATIGEAEVFAHAGFGDIFIAYPVVASPPKAARLRALNEQVTLSVGVGSVESAALLGAIGGMRVVIEVDCGQHKTGVAANQAGVLARACADAGLDVIGAFVHAGHSYRPGAAAPAADDEVNALTEAGERLSDSGFEVRVLSAGSTPTATLSARGAVTEERPGTYVFGDGQQTALGSNRPEDVALVVASTVVHRTDAGFVVDAGAKALTKDVPATLDGHGAIVGLPGAKITGLYDHHGLVEIPAGTEVPAIGSVVAIVPNHVCPVVNQFDEFVVVRGEVLEDRWPVDARARSA